MSRRQAALVGLMAVLVVAVLLVLGVAVITTLRPAGRAMPTPASWPNSTPVPSSTPPPTWTPTRPPTSVPTPNVVAEVNAYLDQLDPLLHANEELWEAWDNWYGGGQTIEYCNNHRDAVKTRYRELEARQIAVNDDLASLVPAKPLRHTHSLIVSSVRFSLEGHSHNFEGCMQGQPQWFTAAGIAFDRSHEEWIAAMDEIREVLADLGIERGQELPPRSEVQG